MKTPSHSLSALDLAFISFCLRKLSGEPTRFTDRTEYYAGEMSARWAREFGSTQEAQQAVKEEGMTLIETAKACSALAALGRATILAHIGKATGWDG